MEKTERRTANSLVCIPGEKRTSAPHLSFQLTWTARASARSIVFIIS